MLFYRTWCFLFLWNICHHPLPSWAIFTAERRSRCHQLQDQHKPSLDLLTAAVMTLKWSLEGEERRLPHPYQQPWFLSYWSPCCPLSREDTIWRGSPARQPPLPGRTIQLFLLFHPNSVSKTLWVLVSRGWFQLHFQHHRENASFFTWTLSSCSTYSKQVSRKHFTELGEFQHFTLPVPRRASSTLSDQWQYEDRHGPEAESHQNFPDIQDCIVFLFQNSLTPGSATGAQRDTMLLSCHWCLQRITSLKQPAEGFSIPKPCPKDHNRACTLQILQRTSRRIRSHPWERRYFRPRLRDLLWEKILSWRGQLDLASSPLSPT